MNVEEGRRCEQTLLTLEETVNGWVQYLTRTLQDQTLDQAACKKGGPLGELELWRKRHVFLSSLMEQLQSKSVQEVLRVIQEATSEDHKLVHCFETHVADAKKLLVEARDNVKFLTTLERHFKTLETGSLTAMCEALPPLMNALRMVAILFKS